MSIVLEKIKEEILSWLDVTAEQHKFGGIEFRLNKREMRHIHESLLSGGSISLFRAAIRNEATRDPYERRLSIFYVESEWIRLAAFIPNQLFVIVLVINN